MGITCDVPRLVPQQQFAIPGSCKRKDTRSVYYGVPRAVFSVRAFE